MASAARLRPPPCRGCLTHLDHLRTPQERRAKLEEAIAKSKLARLEKKEQKSEDERLLQQLDGDFAALRGAIFQAANAAAPTPPAVQPAAYDDYETVMKALGNEQRAAPSGRLVENAPPGSCHDPAPTGRPGGSKGRGRAGPNRCACRAARKRGPAAGGLTSSPQPARARRRPSDLPRPGRTG